MGRCLVRTGLGRFAESVIGERHKISFSAPQAGTALDAPNLRSIPGASCELLQPSSSASHPWSVHRTHGNTRLELLTLADQAESGTVRRTRTASQERSSSIHLCDKRIQPLCKISRPFRANPRVQPQSC
jgi:hypothetical protein